MHRAADEENRWLKLLKALPDAERCLVHVCRLEARGASYAEVDPPLPAPLARALAQQGIEKLYVHQAQALHLVRNGRHVVVVTGTASGKTLAYNLPILESCLERPQSCALYLYPTKALCQDQHHSLRELVLCEPRLLAAARSGIYDGDTPVAERRQIRASANLIFTNPDMLHRALLPYHGRWARLFSELRYVVLDELHAYRGIFGSHVACVLRRLRRICRHYGSDPVFIAASATIGNPGELAERLVGLPFEVVDQDGAPRGPRWFCFWNPPAYDLERGGRRNPQDDAVLLLRALILQGAQTIAFALSRLGVELLYRYVRDALEREAPRLVERIRPYRGGYLPEERRAIERALFHGRLRAVISTNALELGIDVGSLDAAVLVGYPGTIASTWQQAGRAGRTTADSLAVLVARNDPIDQFLVRHPEYFFGCSPEHAVVDPTNPYILVRHLACAVHELPLDAPADSPLFGQRLPSIVTALLEEGHVRERRGKYYPRSTQNPAPYISLRQISDHTVTIVLQQQSDQGKQQHQVLATVDELSAYQLVYPQAVYVHEGETYVVRELDTEQRIAYVERKETGYYTQAIVETSVHIEHEEQWALYEAGNRPGSADEEQPSHERWPNTLRSAWLGTPTLRERSEEIRFRVGLGELEVSWRTVAFKKIRFHTRENLGLGPVSLPAQSFVTTGLWLTPDSTLLRKVTPLHANPPDVLLALLHLCLHAMPLVSMSDVQDVGGTLDSSNLGALSLFLYDRYPGGLGYCEKAYQRLGELLRLAYEIVRDCPCSSGCPSCVGVGRRLGPHVDPDLARSSIIPDKEGALRLLTTLVHTPLRRKEDLQAIGSF